MWWLGSGDNANYELLYKHRLRPGRKDRSRPTGSICDISSPGDPVSCPPRGGPRRNQSSSRRRWGWCRWSGSSSTCWERPGQDRNISFHSTNTSQSSAVVAEVVTDHQASPARLFIFLGQFWLWWWKSIKAISSKAYQDCGNLTIAREEGTQGQSLL